MNQFPTEKLLTVWRELGYDMRPEYWTDPASKHLTCHMTCFTGTFGKAKVFISIAPLDGNRFDLLCHVGEACVATFILQPISQGWRLEYWNHWGEYLQGKLPGMRTQAAKIMVQWDVV